MYNKNMLKAVIVGYGEMATSLMLGAIEAGHEVVGVFRYERVEHHPVILTLKDLFFPSDFHLLAHNKKIYDIKARSVNSNKYKYEILKLNPDVVLVGSWGEKFKKSAIILPRLGTINCHPSMLPKYRGPNPYMSTIYMGEESTGVSFHLMSEKLDEGEILLQKEVPILHDDTGYSLKMRCCKEARDLTKELFDGLLNATLMPKKQNENEASYFPRITNKNIYINFSKPCEVIYNKIRAFRPWLYSYVRIPQGFLQVKHSRIIDLNEKVFFFNNKKYKIPKINQTSAGKILLKGKNWILAATIDEDKAILLENVKWYGLFKQFLTPFIIKKLKTLYFG